MSLVEWLDLPPFWLALAVGLVWVSPAQLPFGRAPIAGVFLILIAAALVLAALLAFRAARTSVVPRQPPTALITSGVFRWTRNPIYLADLLILLGFTLIWGRLLGLVLLPLLYLVLDRRFIQSEEKRLRAAFGETYERYMENTRRWL